MIYIDIVTLGLLLQFTPIRHSNTPEPHWYETYYIWFPISNLLLFIWCSDVTFVLLYGITLLSFLDASVLSTSICNWKNWYDNQWLDLYKVDLILSLSRLMYSVWNIFYPYFLVLKPNFTLELGAYFLSSFISRRTTTLDVLSRS